MPRPTAPMLTAEYHNYNDPQMNDFYGSYEPETAPYAPGAGTPRRIENDKKDKKQCIPSETWTKSVIFCLMIRSLCVITLIILMYSSDIFYSPLCYLIAFESLTILSCILMSIGITKHQPFICVPFVVMRTIEAFLWLCICVYLAMAIYDTNSDMNHQMESIVKMLFQKSKIRHDMMNIKDLTIQICLFLLFISSFIFAICLFACRVAWICTIKVTDNYKRKRSRDNHQVSRVMVASDEMYTNY